MRFVLVPRGSRNFRQDGARAGAGRASMDAQSEGLFPVDLVAPSCAHSADLWGRLNNTKYSRTQSGAV